MHVGLIGFRVSVKLPSTKAGESQAHNRKLPIETEGFMVEGLGV